MLAGIMNTEGEKVVPDDARKGLIRIAMQLNEPSSHVWEQIELSESYLVCSMFEEAAVLASSVLKHVCDNKLTEAVEDIQLLDMMEAAGMVLVQSLKELGRTPEVLDELKVLFGTVTAIPVQVLLAGACIQVSEGFSSSCQQILEEFLSMWRCVDEQYYVLIGEEANVAQMEKCVGRSVLKVDEYLEVAEIYVVNILGMVSRDMDAATSWVEKAVLPEGRRQELLRRLHSLCSLKATISSQSSPLPTDAQEGRVSKKSNLFEGSPEVLKAQYRPNGEDVKKQAILRLSGRVDSWFGCFRTITLKFGSVQFVISNGKILLGCLMLFMYYILRRKRETLKRMVRKQALSMKKALVDLWQLAFSYQVNPLAAVQPLPAATHGSR